MNNIDREYKKKNLLFVYHRMDIGGSTSSLLSLLNCLDYSKYDVDVALYENKGRLLGAIPNEVSVLPAIKKASHLPLLFSLCFWRALVYRFIFKKQRIAMQLMCQARLRTSRKIEKQYDVAIGYLECWPSYYISSNRIKANKRIAWIHTDYIAAGFKSKFDLKCFQQLDTIVTVSNGCVSSLTTAFPSLKNNITKIENIVSKQLLVSLSKKDVVKRSRSSVLFVVVCRMDIHVKGLDRLLEIFHILEVEGYEFGCMFVGNDDSGEFEKLLLGYGFKNDIRYLGPQDNPYPYMIAADVCLQLSRYEGKPIVVDEALKLGLPVVATDYSSAREQIADGVYGIVLDNNEESIARGLRFILSNRDMIEQFKENLKSYTNESDECALRSFTELIGE